MPFVELLGIFVAMYRKQKAELLAYILMKKWKFPFHDDYSITIEITCNLVLSHLLTACRQCRSSEKRYANCLLGLVKNVLRRVI